MDRPDIHSAPDDAAALAHQGTERRLHGRHAEAADFYRQALALERGQVDAQIGLAALLCEQGNAAAAAQHLRGLVEQYPDAVSLRTALGDVEYDLGHYGAALKCFEHVLDRRPGHPGSRLGLARCLSRRPGLALRLRSRRHLLEALTAEEVDPELVSQAACVLLRASPSPAEDAERPGELARLDDPLLLAVVREAAVPDLVVEGALTRVRRALCLDPPREAPELALALAEQCRLNEGAWAVSPEEQARLTAAPALAPAAEPAPAPPPTPAWVRAMYDPGEVAPELVERGRRIPSLRPVSAGTSVAVRDQYEANPYPRWERLSRVPPVDLDQHLRRLTGGRWDPPDFLSRPHLLVAGCGTGRELLGAACTWRPAAVTAFDLSRTSLAYAARQAARLGVEVELYQADLLRLDGWERSFDAIVCTGVLHHLDDPVEGWRTLVRLLRPGGVMLVGLYSETARRGIAAAQAEVRALGRPPTPRGIRAARARLAGLPPDHPARYCLLLRDFSYASGCRDLLFHVHEQHFTLPRIAAALDELGLTYLTFEIEGRVRHLSRTLFGSGADLACWQSLERLYPETFLGMYQFWCQMGRRAP